MILFCLPYAGGSSAIYYPWKKKVNNSIKIVPIELKGRGVRYKETYYYDINEVIDDIFSIISSEIGNNDYAIFGHSMGAILAYEVYYKIIQNNMNKPKHMFFSGAKTPNIIGDSLHISEATDNEIKQYIGNLGGTPDELLQDDNIFNMFLPRIKNDFRLLENYRYEEKGKKIDCDVSILNGKHDEITAIELYGWKTLCDKKVSFYNFNGDHFFINEHQDKICELINKILVEI